MTPTLAAAAEIARLDRDLSLLLIVDIQEKLALHVEDRDAIVARSAALLAAARLFAVPCLLTEHCAADIGPAIAPLRKHFAPNEIFGKTRFGAVDHAEFESLFRSFGRHQVVVVGMEAHVCVMQTVLGLRAKGFRVFVAADAIGSRKARATDRALAIERMREAGAAIAGTETLLFEWTRAGDDVAFRDVLALVKRLPK